MNRFFVLLAVATMSLATANAVAAVKTDVYELKTPPTTGGNRYYVSNRSPLMPSPLIKLPITAITPHGWLREQLRLMAHGMVGHLYKISPYLQPGSGWLDPSKPGWEEVPYWLRGFGDLGYILKDPRIIAQAKKWIDAVIASQQSDGYFGPDINKANHDLWPNMVMLYAIRSYYEYTHDRRILPFMERYFRYELSLPSRYFLPGSWQQVRGGDNLESVYWLYNRTGDPKLLQLATRIYQHASDWSAGITSYHGVNFTESFAEPGYYYLQAKKPSLLADVERNYHQMMGTFGQVPGGMLAADENARPGFTGPQQAAETCAMVEFMHSDEVMLEITGEPRYADRCENIAFNSLPAAFTPDYTALHYLTAPNLVQCDPGGSHLFQNQGMMVAYSAGPAYRCCEHNAGFGWPYFTERLWMATQANGLAALFYAPCGVSAKVGSGVPIHISETTDYPFGENIHLSLAMGKPVQFPLLLRIPKWASGARVRLNGRPLPLRPAPEGYAVVNRLWHNGDRVDLHLPMKVEVNVWKAQQDAVSVNRGPLSYALKIGEKWQQCAGGTSQWPNWAVYPTTSWNYGLVLEKSNLARSFRVVRKKGPLAAQPFNLDAAPIELIATGKRIPGWSLVDNTCGPLPPSPVASDKPAQRIVLIPMGCERLRISEFPVIGSGPEAHQVFPPIEMAASHCWQTDTVAALNDGIDPTSSNDQQVPRFTWWDHRGTTEWVQYTFPKPQRVSSVAVYWFDDTGVGSCRAPASWQVLYRDGGGWTPVKAAGVYGVGLNRYNRVTFNPVITGGLRILVHLKPSFSGGILQWQVMDGSKLIVK